MWFLALLIHLLHIFNLVLLHFTYCIIRLFSCQSCLIKFVRLFVRSEKAERNSGNVELSHGSIPDVAAMLPVGSDNELPDVDINDADDDDIAESLQRSHLLDTQDSSDVQSFMLVDHNEELQVCRSFMILIFFLTFCTV